MEERESMKGKRDTVHGESKSGACIERKRTNRAWNFSVESAALNVAKTEKTDVLYPVLDRLSRPIEEGRRRKKEKKGVERRWYPEWITESDGIADRKVLLVYSSATPHHSATFAEVSFRRTPYFDLSPRRVR